MSEAIASDPPLATASGGRRKIRPSDAEIAQDSPTVVIDLGSKSKSKIKRLRKGRGPLMARVQDAVDQIAQDPSLSAASPVVVVVVKKRKKSRGLFG